MLKLISNFIREFKPLCLIDGEAVICEKNENHEQVFLGAFEFVTDYERVDSELSNNIKYIVIKKKKKNWPFEFWHNKISEKTCFKVSKELSWTLEESNQAQKQHGRQYFYQPKVKNYFIYFSY